MRMTLYIIFAAFATLVNIASQDISYQTYHGEYRLILSVLIGTTAGLMVKYFLDKKYIFQFNTPSMKQNSKTFMLYSIMGFVTTIIFWTFEFSFHFIFDTKEMRYLGGIFGLSIGYLAKYQLDKRYVFHGEAI